MVDFTQSLPICYALSAIGGILEVGSTAVLAVPDAARKKVYIFLGGYQRLLLPQM